MQNKYFKKFATRTSRYFAQISDFSARDIAVSVPILAEKEHVARCVQSIGRAIESSKNPFSARLVFVVNRKKNSDENVKENNEFCMKFLKETKIKNARIDVIDATSENFAFNAGDGVGFARKIGLDFAAFCGDQILANLDADCVVDENFFDCIYDFYIKNKNFNKKTFALFDFSHDVSNCDENLRNKIADYEKYLRNHSESLRKIGSPYFPVSLAPTITCSRAAYFACGGMRENEAGEDFYFLQSLVKACVLQGRRENFAFLPSAVHPAARVSARTPFGTGRVMASDVPRNFSESDFVKLGKIFSLFDSEFFNRGLDENFASDFEKSVEGIDFRIADFLRAEKFFARYQSALRSAKPCPDAAKRVFHMVFDGLATIRALHFLSNERLVC